jgi:hypothetical protein
MDYLLISMFVSFVAAVLLLFWLRKSGNGKRITRGVAMEWMKRGKNYDARKSIDQAFAFGVLSATEAAELIKELDL